MKMTVKEWTSMKEIPAQYSGDFENVKKGLINSLKYYKGKKKKLKSLENYEVKKLTDKNLNYIFDLQSICINAPTFNQIFVKELRDAYRNLLRAECHFQL